MSSKSFVVFAFFAFFLFGCLVDKTQAQNCTQDKVVFCYYASWAVYRPRFGAFSVDDIDPSLCTHLLYGFAGLNIEGVTFSLDPQNDLPEIGGNQQYYYFRMLKEKNPCVKTLLSIGGWDEGSEKYSIMAENEESRSKFIDHLIRYLAYYGFDGVDLDWEYPSQRGGISNDKQNYVLLLTELRSRLSPRGKLLCAAVGANTDMIQEAYDVTKLSQQLDYVLLMAYDYHQNNVTSHLAPLRRKAGDSNVGSVSESVQKWLDSGCPREKLVLGIVTSGRTFTLQKPNLKPEDNGLGLNISAPGMGGPFTNVTGFMSYYEICDMLIEDKSWYSVSNHDIYASSFATKGNQWITYEDISTIKAKAEYARAERLAGVMVYSIDTDDFRAFCGANTNTMQKTIRTALGMA